MNPITALLIAFMMIFSAPLFAADSRDALIDAQMESAEGLKAQQEPTLKDGLGYVHQVAGKAMMAAEGNPVEKKLKVGDVVKAGDQIYTEKKSSVSIVFDFLKQNAVHIPELSRAVFTSIEPNDIKLETGSIFSAVDGLPKGSTWKVTTPVAVAAVRGTLYLVRFQAESGEFYAATVDVPDDGRDSAIEISLITADNLASIAEGKQITLREGDSSGLQDMVQDLNPEAVKEIQQFFDQIKGDQEKTLAAAVQGYLDNKHETQGNESSDDNSSWDDIGSDMSEKTEMQVNDNLPNLDPSEDFKDQHGQKDLENAENANTKDPNYYGSST
ncbi:MAG TPA: FecR domain-containing protein [Candidatus Omnitrophota bacterium]|nr:FecR domain-containing protein [Candidatus Omnitrophota bacterium]